MSKYDALLVVSFGGPEGPDQIDDFLDRIASGRNIPAERLAEVKQRYLSFGGVSPANENNRKLIAQLKKEFAGTEMAGEETSGTGLKDGSLKGGSLKDMSIYLGNRNSPPFIEDALAQMQQDKKTKALAFITSPFASYSSCRQYLENIESSQKNLGKDAPQVDRLRHFYNHPLFIEIHADSIVQALSELPADSKPHILFSAHSLPLVLAQNCDYSAQLMSACEMVMGEIKNAPTWELTYQSISGSPENWLSPDILTSINGVKENPQTDAVLVSPIGFLASHMEVIFDLDTDAKNHAENLGLAFARAKTPQDDARFTSLILELIKERTASLEPQSLDGTIPPNHCPPNCCQEKTSLKST